MIQTLRKRGGEVTLEQMKARKVELGYTNEKLAELSGVPLGTVQKIFAGVTKAPRYDTIQKLEKVLGQTVSYSVDSDGASELAETVHVYSAESSNYKKQGRKAKEIPIKPMKIKLGMFDGKYKVPPEELFYNDDIAEMFEDM